MSIIEKELAEAIIEYERLKAEKDHDVYVDIDQHLIVLHAWLKRETALRNAEEAAWADPDVLEKTDEANRGHRLRVNRFDEAVESLQHPSHGAVSS